MTQGLKYKIKWGDMFQKPIQHRDPNKKLKLEPLDKQGWTGRERRTFLVVFRKGLGKLRPPAPSGLPRQVGDRRAQEGDAERATGCERAWGAGECVPVSPTPAAAVV